MSEGCQHGQRACLPLDLQLAIAAHSRVNAAVEVREEEAKEESEAVDGST